MLLHKSLVLVLCLPLLFGCAAQQERAAKCHIKHTCKRLMGCSEEEVILKLGVPQNIQKIGSLNVYQYYKSYGMRSSKADHVTRRKSKSRSKTWEAYDKIEVFFKNGCAMSWKSSVKR